MPTRTFPFSKGEHTITKREWERVGTGTYGVYRRNNGGNGNWGWGIIGIIILLIIFIYS